ncbi:MAG: hypothetical protein ACKVP6_14175 [Mycobacterium sp.]
MRWHDGDSWAKVEGAPDAVASAFGVAVHDHPAPLHSAGDRWHAEPAKRGIHHGSADDPYRRARPEPNLVMVNARPTVESGAAYEKLGWLMQSVDRQFPGAIWTFSIGWGSDRLITAADLAPVREALAAAHRYGTTAFDATGNLAGLECRGGHNWSDPPSPDDVGVDAVASEPAMTPKSM